jgi:hypothetical protein
VGCKHEEADCALFGGLPDGVWYDLPCQKNGAGWAGPETITQ